MNYKKSCIKYKIINSKVYTKFIFILRINIHMKNYKKKLKRSKYISLKRKTASRQKIIKIRQNWNIYNL